MMIHICHSTYTGNDDYRVTDWNAAKQEAKQIITYGLNYICDANLAQEIKEMLECENWMKAVDLYNDHNAMKELLEIYEVK